MRLSKSNFILLLALFFISPFLIYKIVWIARAIPATGTMCFMGKTLNGQFSSDYPVLKFTATGKDTVFFNGAEGVVLTRDEQVPIRYYRNNPAGARVNNFQGMWVDTVIYAAIPLVILLIIFFHPGIIPKNSIIVIGQKPFVKLVEK